MSAPSAPEPAGRLRDAADRAIAGRAPGHVASPGTPAEAAEAVRACAADGGALVPWGGGVALANESEAPPRYDVALELSGLRRIVAYDPDDFTVTAECGIPLAELRAALDAHGQELPIEAAHEESATLGGALAANACGPRRRALGSPRDRILGARLVTGDGEPVRTGGRVVKNVAGHAVHRLLVGSRGGLGVLVEASLKLLPHPPARALVVHGLGPVELVAAGRWAGLSRREPAALTVVSRAAAPADPRLATAAPFTVLTGFEGDPAWVDACIAFVTDRLGAPHATLRDRDVPATWRALTDLEERPGPRATFVTAANTPAALAPALAGDGGPPLVFHAPSGRLIAWPGPGAGAPLASALARAGFAAIGARGPEAAMPAAPAAVRALRAALATALDPRGTMAYGGRWRAGN